MSSSVFVFLYFFIKSAEAIHFTAQHINYIVKTAFSFSEIARYSHGPGEPNQRL